MMSWQDAEGVPDLIRRAYAEPVADPPDDGQPLALQVFDYVGQAMAELDRREDGLGAQRRSIEAAAELLRSARLELAEERQVLRWDRGLNAAVAVALVIWTTACQGWSRMPPPVIGGFLIAALGAVLYYHLGRHWLRRD